MNNLLSIYLTIDFIQSAIFISSSTERGFSNPCLGEPGFVLKNYATADKNVRPPILELHSISRLLVLISHCNPGKSSGRCGHRSDLFAIAEYSDRRILGIGIVDDSRAFALGIAKHGAGRNRSVAVPVNLS